MATREIYILVISETKLGDYLPLSKGFCTPFRLDRNKNNGGILLDIRSHKTSTRLKKICSKESKYFLWKI